MAPIREEARAKVNLTLQVRGRRPDGYHCLESLIAFAAGVGDEVTLTLSEHPAVHIVGPFAGAIAGKNLLERTLDKLAAEEPRLRLGRVDLTKHLPVAAGLGGGSADAAALLRAVRRANPDLAAGIDWMKIAAALGADVPVCLASRPALAWGVGERIVELPGLPQIPAVLANALASVPPDKTARVFGSLAAPAIGEPPGPAALPSFGGLASLLDFMRTRGNDLLPAAQSVLPSIAATRAALASDPRCLYAGLSGAGPTCFGIFATGEDAAVAAAHLKRAQPGWWIAPTVLG
jgi:4-diphosphocytidyl-2-C-methyl-D-erythritol kinase